jgi:squalene-hopene/tetraprenyl-beta-curcumene cyclase
VEETALAVEALANLLGAQSGTAGEDGKAEIEIAFNKGVGSLMDRIEDGSWVKPAPIGFYFAKLWYFERLYPQIFTVGALGCAARLWRQPPK